MDDQQLRERLHEQIERHVWTDPADVRALLDRVAALTREREEYRIEADKALRYGDGRDLDVQLLEERVAALTRERDDLERAYRQACTNLATIRPDLSRDLSIGEQADLYYDALMAGWGGVEGYDPGRKPREVE